jgi:hypothetical protein
VSELSEIHFNLFCFQCFFKIGAKDDVCGQRMQLPKYPARLPAVQIETVPTTSPKHIGHGMPSIYPTNILAIGADHISESKHFMYSGEQLRFMCAATPPRPGAPARETAPRVREKQQQQRVTL